MTDLIPFAAVIGLGAMLTGLCIGMAAGVWIAATKPSLREQMRNWPPPEGDDISRLMRDEGLKFPEAVETLAARRGYKPRRRPF